MNIFHVKMYGYHTICTSCRHVNQITPQMTRFINYLNGKPYSGTVRMIDYIPVGFDLEQYKLSNFARTPFELPALYFSKLIP